MTPPRSCRGSWAGFPAEPIDLRRDLRVTYGGFGGGGTLSYASIVVAVVRGGLDGYRQ
jgi:hypothetical protein